MKKLTILLLAASVVAAACGSSDGEVVEPAATDAGTGDTETTSASESTVECPPVGGTDTVTQSFPSAPPSCLDPEATYSATVTTNQGEITIDLDQQAAPITVNSFVFLARNNYFDDTVCHRVIQEFVVQCGDPTATGTGGPGYTIVDEFPEAGQYRLGSIAMAKQPAPDTGGSQFFIISGPQGAALPPEYSLFGQVTEPGLAVVEKMNALGSADPSGVPSEEIRILDVEITES